jgi:uncharacterized protein YbjT (DUF2867 family)
MAIARSLTSVQQPMRALVTGATGFVGGRLAAELLEHGDEVACLVRDAGRASELERSGAELYEGDVLERGSLAPALEGADVAYYLIHGMGRGSGATSPSASVMPPATSPLRPARPASRARSTWAGSAAGRAHST